MTVESIVITTALAMVAKARFSAYSGLFSGLLTSKPWRMFAHPFLERLIGGEIRATPGIFRLLAVGTPSDPERCAGSRRQRAVQLHERFGRNSAMPEQALRQSPH
jgi:hypothetical protein